MWVLFVCCCVKFFVNFNISFVVVMFTLQNENANIREFASSPLTHRHPTTIRVCFSTRDNCETSQRKLTSTKFQEHVWSLTLAHTHTYTQSKTSKDIQTDIHLFTCNSTCSWTLTVLRRAKRTNKQTKHQNNRRQPNSAACINFNLQVTEWRTDWRYDDDTHWVCANLIVWLVERRKE